MTRIIGMLCLYQSNDPYYRDFVLAPIKWPVTLLIYIYIYERSPALFCLLSCLCGCVCAVKVRVSLIHPMRLALRQSLHPPPPPAPLPPHLPPPGLPWQAPLVGRTNSAAWSGPGEEERGELSAKTRQIVRSNFVNSFTGNFPPPRGRPWLSQGKVGEGKTIDLFKVWGPAN